MEMQEVLLSLSNYPLIGAVTWWAWKAFRTYVGDMKEQIEDLKGDVAVLKLEVAETRAEVEKYQELWFTCEQSKVELKGELAEIRAEMKAIRREVNGH